MARDRKRPIKNAADEAAETMDVAEDSIKALTPKIAAALDETAETADVAEDSIRILTPKIAAALERIDLAALEVQVAGIQAAKTLKWFRTINGCRLVIHWKNIFYPSRWGKPFTTVEFIFEEV